MKNYLLERKHQIELRLIPPVDPNLIQTELQEGAEKIVTTPEKDGSLETYLIEPGRCPNTLKQIGRLREIMFDLTGGGTGTSCDLDQFDALYCQIISWDPEEKEIVSGYRYILGCDIKVEGNNVNSAVGKLFQFSPEFIQNKLLNGMELGRSFSNFFAKKGVFGLHVIFYGLAYLAKKYNFRYFFGKVTFYPLRMKENSFDSILYFLENQFPTEKKQAKALKKYQTSTPPEIIESLNGERFDWDRGYGWNYQILRKKLKSLQERIEPLLKSYMNLSKELEVFDSVINEECGSVVEILIVMDMTTIDEIRIKQLTTCDLVLWF